MGCSTFSNFTVLPEIAVAKIREDAPFDKVCYIGCGVTTGIGAVINTAKVEPGANVVVFGLGGIGLNVVQGARMVGASMIVGVDLNPAREALGRKFGMTHFVNPKGMSEAELVPYLVNLTRGGADYSFECIGNVKVMRQVVRLRIPASTEAGKFIRLRHAEMLDDKGELWTAGLRKAKASVTSTGMVQGDFIIRSRMADSAHVRWGNRTGEFHGPVPQQRLQHVRPHAESDCVDRARTGFGNALGFRSCNYVDFGVSQTARGRRCQFPGSPSKNERTSRNLRHPNPGQLTPNFELNSKIQTSVGGPIDRHEEAEPALRQRLVRYRAHA
jgi:hypothetical protein